jgi:hypothetical protein
MRKRAEGRGKGGDFLIKRGFADRKVTEFLKIQPPLPRERLKLL